MLEIGIKVNTDPLRKGITDAKAFEKELDKLEKLGKLDIDISGLKTFAEAAQTMDVLIDRQLKLEQVARRSGSVLGTAAREQLEVLKKQRQELEKQLDLTEKKEKLFQGGGSGGGTGGGIGSGASNRDMGNMLKKAVGWGLAAAGVGTVMGYVASSRHEYRRALDMEGPLWALGSKGARGRAGMATGLGYAPGDYYDLESSLVRGTGLSEHTGLARSAMLTASFARFAGVDTGEAAGLRTGMYRATGSNARIPDAMLVAIGKATATGFEKSKLPELLEIIGRNTGSTAQAMAGTGMSGAQAGMAFLMAREGISQGGTFAKSGEFYGLMQNGLKGAGTAPGEIMLWDALGGFNGQMTWSKIHDINRMKQGGFMERPDLLLKVLGNLSGSDGDQAGQLEEMFPSWNLKGKGSETILKMKNSGFLAKLAASKGRTIEQMAAKGDKEAARWMKELQGNPALAKLSTEARNDAIKIEAGEQLSRLFLPLEKATGDLAKTVVDWTKGVHDLEPLSKALLAAGGLYMAGGLLNFGGGAMGLGRAGAGLLGGAGGPISALLAGFGIAYGGFKDGAGTVPIDRMNAITGKNSTEAKYSRDWVPFKSSFDKAARATGVDEDLLFAVARTESGFKPNAISGKGAVGIMQLMPKTAQGLHVDPTDPESNIMGGSRFLASLLQRYNGDVDKSLAAYNWGPGNVDKKGMSNLPSETQDYIASVKAAQAGYAGSGTGAPGGDSTQQMLVQILNVIAENTGALVAGTNQPKSQALPVGN